MVFRSYCEQGVSAGFKVLSMGQRSYCEEGVAGLSSGEDSAEGASSALSRWEPCLLQAIFEVENNGADDMMTQAAGFDKSAFPFFLLPSAFSAFICTATSLKPGH